MMRLNGDATASYIGQQLIGFASTAAAAALGAAGEGRIGACPGSGATANFYGAIETRFPGYRQSGFKPWIAQAFGLQGRRLDGHARRWLLEQDDRDQSPASIPNAGPNLVAGSMGTLYGLRG
jgi:hypothetical protein